MSSSFIQSTFSACPTFFTPTPCAFNYLASIVTLISISKVKQK